MREIIRASAWTGFRELVAELGGDVDAILAGAQVDVRALLDPERYLPLRSYVDTMALAADMLRRKDFGLVFGQRQGLSMLGAMSIAIINSPTARHGIEIASRYMHVHNAAFIMTLSPMPRTTREFLSLAVEMRGSSRREQNDERIVSSIHKSLGVLGGGKYRPHEIWFTHEPISSLTVYRNAFGVTPQFGKPAMGIAIEGAILDSWRPGGSSEMREIAETYLEQLGARPDKSFTNGVTSMARSLLQSREFTPEHVAKTLSVHARTLQRRLKDEGTSFEKIKDDARREWAESLLAQSSVTLSQIALMLDYADSSAFSRSCRRWFGEAPRIYRKRLIDGRTPKTAGPRGSRVKQYETKLLAKSTRV